ncbi:MAG: sulfite exporter TauE/SafE family protein [Acidimicrobiia bacterium]
MTPLDALAIFAAGTAAGTINTVVGSGSLVTFPTLLALGYSPLVANVSNNVGLVPGSLSGAYGYRRELVGQRDRLMRVGPASLLGGLTGAVLLLTLPSSYFDAVVPVLIAVALMLVIFGPKLSRFINRRKAEAHRTLHGVTAPMFASIFLAGVYGGYFGAAQGVILIALLTIFVDDHVQRLNAAKNVLGTLVNASAALVFTFASDVDWAVAGVLALGATLGGQIGSRVGRRLDPRVLRVLIVVVGIAAIIKLLR